MKVKLAVAVAGILAICLLPSCRDYTSDEYVEATTNYAEAQGKIVKLNAQLQEKQAKVAELESELEAHQTEVADLEAELEALQETYHTNIADLEAQLEALQEAYDTNIAALEAELEAYQAETATTEEEPPPPPPPTEPEPTFLQEETLSYRGFEGVLVSVRMTMLDASWDENKLTVSWEVTNAGKRRIYLNLLSVKARDQMGIWGEINDSVEPVPIYPDLQAIQMPWPGETVAFNIEWEFGPLSEEITIEFVVVRSQEDYLKYAADDILRSFYVTRPSSE